MRRSVIVILLFIIFGGCTSKKKESLYIETFDTKTVQSTNGDLTEIFTQSTSYKKDLNDDEIKKTINNSIDEYYSDITIKSEETLNINGIPYKFSHNMTETDYLKCSYREWAWPKNGIIKDWDKMPQGTLLREGAFDVSYFGRLLSPYENFTFQTAYLTEGGYTAYKLIESNNKIVQESEDFIYLSEGKTHINLNKKRETIYNIIYKSKQLMLRGTCISYKKIEK